MLLALIIKEIWNLLKMIGHAFFGGQITVIQAVAKAMAPILGYELKGNDKHALTYDERLEELASKLRHSAGEAQSLLVEMERDFSERVRVLADVEAKVAELEDEERDLAERLEILRTVRPDVGEALASIVDQSLDRREKASSRRDYVIFLIGVVITAVTFILGIWLT
ncbi:hypothetical protein [Flindersiella endophytica]